MLMETSQSPSEYRGQLEKGDPLLLEIAFDGLSWLVHDSLQRGLIKGINTGYNSQTCLEIFVDDTNALIENEDKILVKYNNDI